MTNTNPLPTSDQPYVVAEGEGIHTHFLNNLATTKVAAGESALMSVVQFKAPRGFGPPVHVHDDEDELVVVTEGAVAFRSGDDETIAGPGGMAFLPRAIPHTFQVLSDTATMISVTASETGKPLFDTFVGALSTPATEAVIPPHTEIDGGRVARVGADHKIGIVGPPPPPLDDVEGFGWDEGVAAAVDAATPKILGAGIGGRPVGVTGSEPAGVWGDFPLPKDS